MLPAAQPRPSQRSPLSFPFLSGARLTDPMEVEYNFPKITPSPTYNLAFGFFSPRGNGIVAWPGPSWISGPRKQTLGVSGVRHRLGFPVPRTAWRRARILSGRSRGGLRLAHVTSPTSSPPPPTRGLCQSRTPPVHLPAAATSVRLPLPFIPCPHHRANHSCLWFHNTLYGTR